MSNKKYIDVSQAMDRATVFDWYISSVDDTQSPIWTDEHIEELTNDFCLVHKDIPLVEVKPLKHGKWTINSDGYYPYCSCCKEEPKSGIMTKYCPNCGSKMDLEE